MHHAYFSKYKMWGYEEECRLVDDGESVEVVGGSSILFIPSKCITALIVGKNIPENEIRKSKDFAAKNELAWFQSNIGKSLPLPFLRNEDKEAFVFDGRSIVAASPICVECKEPFQGKGDLCPWCSITDDHQYEAAISNPFRMLEQAGGLDDYFAFVNKAQKSTKKP